MKKLTALALALVLAFPASLSLAAEPPLMESRLRQIEAQCYAQDLARAVYIDEEGEETLLDVTYTVSVVSPAPGMGTFSAMSANVDAPVTYAVTASASAKTESGEATGKLDGVDIKLYLTMYWTDVFGPKNTIDKLAGSYVLTKGTVTKSYVEYSYDRIVQLKDSISLGTVSSFERSINWTTPSLIGSLYAGYTVGLAGAHLIRVDVTPSIFD